MRGAVRHYALSAAGRGDMALPPGRAGINVSGDQVAMASGMDMKAARSTYEGFIGLIKWSIPAIGALTALVVYLLTH
jgi:hypothetical protein